MPTTIAQPTPTIPERQRAFAKPKPFHIASLDGIRGLAFLLVFFSHAGLEHIVPGGFGVTVFFVLSGYLITTLLREEYRENQRIDLKAFYLRRTFRILPLFYTVLAAALVLRYVGQTGGDLHKLAVLAQIFHWSNYYVMSHGSEAVAGGTIVLWSLAVEEHFYLVFPPLYALMSKHLRVAAQVRWVLGACLACLLWRCFLIFKIHNGTGHAELGTDTRFDCLLFGALLAIAANPALDASRWLLQRWLKMLAPVALACLVFTFVYRNEDFRFTFRFTLQALALLPLFAYAIIVRGSVIFRFLNHPLMTSLGVLSYALYLIHDIILNWFTIHLHAGTPVVAIVTLATALLVAKFLQVAVERPFQNLRRKYTRIHP